MTATLAKSLRCAASLAELYEDILSDDSKTDAKTGIKIGIGSRVCVLWNESVRWFTVIATNIQNDLNLVSTQSDMGKAILGKQIGDKIKFTLCGSEQEAEIIDIH